VNLGLGITVRTPVAIPPDLAVLDGRCGLPALPPIHVPLCGRSVEVNRPAIDCLRAILEESLAVSIHAPA
jgi:hypothetical protein